MSKVDFYSLARAVQDRLLDSLHGQFAPHPILVKVGPHRTARLWLGATLVAAALLAGLAVAGYGNPASALSLQPMPLVGAYAILVAAIVGGVLSAASLQARIRALPFAPGIYLFQSSVIDARKHVLRVFPLNELSNVTASPPGSLTLAFPGEAFQLPLTEPSRAAEAVELVETARARLAQELDAKDRFAIDPLEPPAVASPLGPATPIVRKPAIWETARWAIAIGVGILVGAGIHQVRNKMSDDRMLAQARARDDVAAYKSYVARGRAHRELVANEWLPRAALKLAINAGSVEAIDEFKRDYPGNNIGAEVDAARRNALVAQFEAARKLGTLAALLEYADRYPDHGIGPAFDQAKHALYRNALARAKADLPGDGSEKTAAFLEKLFAFAEKTGTKKVGEARLGPEIQIRFGRVPSLALARSDLAVSKNPMFNGPTSSPTRYFDKARLTPEEERVGKEVAERFGKAFVPEMLRFVPGPPIELTDDAWPSVDAPTLIISYRIEWSGGAIASKKPRGVYVGLLVFFKTAFALPGDADPLTTKFTAGENVSRDVIDKFPGTPTPGTVEAAVYGAMMRDAFDQLRDRYYEKWFKPAAKP